MDYTLTLWMSLLCEDSTKDAFNLGFDGKSLIHPVQIEYINDIFTPKIWSWRLWKND